ncbi:MAG: zinc metalloprotease, partial [Bacteroidota bacterium]
MRLFELPLSGSPLLWWARKSLLVLLLLGVSVPVVQAQTRRNCGTMEYWDSQLRSNPALNRRMMDVENRTREQAKSGFRAVTGKVNIPVVVHVIYRTGEQNISEAQIRSQIRVLNEDFQRKNADRVKTPAMFGMLAANSGISFQLANRDPQGNPTSGITRHQTSTSAFFSSDNGAKYAAMGGVDAWPSDQYLNIWV